MFYRQFEPYIPRSTVNWRVYKLIQLDIVVRLGRGKFALGVHTQYKPYTSLRFSRINNLIKNRFPYIQFCIWNSSSIIEFGQHIPKTNTTYVDVERDAAESVYYLLKDEYSEVFLRPGINAINEYISDLDKPIIVRTLVTEAPLQLIHGILTITIEKLLVDLFSDEEFTLLQSNELTHIYRNAFDRYSVNKSKLLRYADRKRKKKELEIFLKN